MISIGIFASCGKDSTTTSTPSTTTQKIQKKWRIINSQDINYLGTSTTVDTIIDNIPAISDSIEFKADGKAYYTWFGAPDTVSYSIISDTKIIFDGSEHTINTLDANNFVSTYYERVDTPYFDNVLILKR